MAMSKAELEWRKMVLEAEPDWKYGTSEQEKEVIRKKRKEELEKVESLLHPEGPYEYYLAKYMKDAPTWPTPTAAKQTVTTPTLSRLERRRAYMEKRYDYTPGTIMSGFTGLVDEPKIRRKKLLGK